MGEGTEIVSLNEAIEILGVSRATLYNWIRLGLITPLPKPPVLKKRGHTRFRREDVLKLARGE